MFNLIGADGKQYGPASPDQVREWVRAGRANAQTQAQAANAAEWRPLASYPEFADLLATNAPGSLAAPPQISASVVNQADKKIVAGICGILLGALGVHKFVLGYSNAGAIMLAATLGGFILGFATCGLTFLASSAMSIIGLIEGIIYLSKSNEEFVRTYIDNRKEWF